MSETVYLGVDLGTSRTSITTSTGVRETVWSYVGYPKDHVARKKFGGRDVIFGKEAVDNRMALDLVRPLAGGAIKSRGGTDSQKTKKALKDLVEVRGEPLESSRGQHDLRGHRCTRRGQCRGQVGDPRGSVELHR